MSDYVQPDFYRLNEDSLILVNWVSSQVKLANSLLDLGAGCGVIGIELAQKYSLDFLDFVEVQNDFIPYIEKNVDAFLQGQRGVSIHHTSFAEWNPSKKYDLIVSNPPYYLPGHGQRNSDSRKELARSFIKDGWKILLEKIKLSLDSEGSAFLVIKSDARVLEEIQKYWLGKIEITEQNKLSLLRLHVD
jgi:tRNA1Val (adenine37-N6)-methyltransferase